MLIKTEYWFSVWGLFVHDSDVTGPFSEAKIEELINEGLCSTGYTVSGPDDTSRRAWALFGPDGMLVVSCQLYTSTDAEMMIKKLAPDAHEVLVEIDKQTFEV